MRRIGILLLAVVLILGNVAFAISEPVSEVDWDRLRILGEFDSEFPLEPKIIHDFEYLPSEEAVYVITREHWDYESVPENQYVFSLEGLEIIEDPMYPLIEGYERIGLELYAGHASSLEQSSTEESILYHRFDGSDDREVGEYVKGFAERCEQIIYHLSGCDGDVNFSIATAGMVEFNSNKLVESDYAYNKAYAVTPDGEELVFLGTDNDMDGKWTNYLVRVNITTNDIISVFPLDRFVDEEDDDQYDYEAFDVYATEDEFVVLQKVWDTRRAVIQKYSYDGELLDSVETMHCIRRIAPGPGDSTLFLQMSKNSEPDSNLQLVQIIWDATEESESTGRPRSLISERTVGGQTTAEFRDDGFGLLKVTDSESGAMNYLAPLKSDENIVRLRVPFADLLAKVNLGAENLLIAYRGNEIAIPMSRFDCAELLDGMPCKDDATIEIQLSVAEDGSTKVVIQVYVVEQVDEMTKVVHRKTIQ